MSVVFKTLSTKNSTFATATLSEALAVTAVVPDTVAPLEGDVMKTAGGVVSGGELTVIK